ncbi:MAG TPA: hypothetical protein VHP58_01495 [Alphaproteobacteria bacterium]|nr:hypothetical protein [Alphaproteobacteria bacterium]
MKKPRKRTVYRFATTSPRVARAIGLLLKDGYFVGLVELFDELKKMKRRGPLLTITHYLGEKTPRRHVPPEKV